MDARNIVEAILDCHGEDQWRPHGPTDDAFDDRFVQLGEAVSRPIVEGARLGADRDKRPGLPGFRSRRRRVRRRALDLRRVLTPAGIERTVFFRRDIRGLRIM
ncbi:hypothetical protein [Bosea sp. (in: a-proteobacteria)]|uniref:hypothetical protein n=1 Tax=Bosea sp. (in: a-proteobacteria) TaxID=1871050 RepID=UPI00261D1F4E|nr:hypothetical protein [Bosea sp. (in: a-proteobacteria)]MCO5089453.1 hypothetical protein [Bosea sp. (in: a-proteobacteria)]